MQDFTIDSEFLFPLLRELQPNKSAHYLYNEDLEQSFLKIEGSPILVDWQKEGGGLIEILLKGRMACIRPKGGDSTHFMSIITKYMQPMADEFEVYLNRSELLPESVEVQGLKPKALSSQPSFFNHPRKSSLPTSGEPSSNRIRKLTSAPSLMPLSEIPSSTDSLDLDNIRAGYICYGNNALFDSLFIVHAMINPIVFKQFKKITDKKISETEKAFLHKAKKNLVELERETKKNRDSTLRTSSPTQRTPSPILRSFSPTQRTPSPTKRSPSSTLRTSSPEKKKSYSPEIELTSIGEIEQKLRLNAIEYILLKSLEDADFVLSVFRSFGNQKTTAAKLFHNSVELKKLLTPENKRLGDNIMALVEACFSVDEYNPKANSDEFLIWLNLLIKYIETYRCIPEFFCGGDASIKFLTMMSAHNVMELIESLKRQGLIDLLLEKILHRLAHQHDVQLARLLQKESYKPLDFLLREKNQTHYFFSLLSVKNKTVDFALLAEPKFVDFIQNQKTAIGCYMYAQLLERIKSAFDYKNLPADGAGGSDARQTQSTNELLERGGKRLNALLAYKFLSASEIAMIFMTGEIGVRKNQKSKDWLLIYLKNLSLLLSKFLPHIPEHLHKVADLYVRYYDQTIGRTATIDSDKYDPELHLLKKFPYAIRQYLEECPAELKEFDSNLTQLGEIYSVIKALGDGTIRMNHQQQSGFTPASRVADKVLEKLPKNTTQFTRFTLSKLISILIIEHCQNVFETHGMGEGLCTDKTLEDIRGGDVQLLWMRVEVSDALLVTFEQVINTLRNPDDNSFSEDSFNEEPVIRAIEIFWKENILGLHRKVSLGRSSFSVGML